VTIRDTETEWTPFECEGRLFEYLAVPTTHRQQSHGPSARVVLLVVRRPGDRTGPAMVYPEGTVVTVEHALNTARFFWSQLTEHE
jgi:hypothetical protein